MYIKWLIYKKSGFIAGVTLFIIALSAFAGINGVSAALDKGEGGAVMMKNNCGCESHGVNYLQETSEKKRYFMLYIADDLFSIFSVKEAQANESVADCRIFCKVWHWCTGCEEWLPEASQYCKDNFSIPPK